MLPQSGCICTTLCLITTMTHTKTFGHMQIYRYLVLFSHFAYMIDFNLFLIHAIFWFQNDLVFIFNHFIRAFMGWLKFLPNLVYHRCLVHHLQHRYHRWTTFIHNLRLPINQLKLQSLKHRTLWLGISTWVPFLILCNPYFLSVFFYWWLLT